MTDVHAVVNSIALILFLGIITGRFAEKRNFPKMVPLIIIGMVYARYDNTNFHQFSDDALKETALVLAELTLIMVLYNEGMHLNLKSLRQNFLPIILLAVVGTIMTVIFVSVILTSFAQNIRGEDIAFFSITALLTAAVIVPTDPAATFAILKNSGGDINPKIETILGGESAFNDITAILLVLILFVPKVIAGEDTLENIELRETGSVIAKQLLGGIGFGLLVALITIIIMRRLSSGPEFSYVSASGAIAIFLFASELGVSAAIAALVAGIFTKNPRFLLFTKKYDEPALLSFWDDLTYIIEIFAFVFIGILFTFEDFWHKLGVGLLMSTVVIVSRLLSVYMSTLPLELTPFTHNILSNKERFFISIAGFRGLTTVVLALFSYISIAELDEKLADLILLSALSLILVSGIVQGLLLPSVTRKTGVIEQ
ncbi:MAG: cation:proton antiporter domain-containing protein [Candidatus Kariarchaeaceae archaeon]